MVTLEVTEKMAFEICKKYELLSPLYELGIKRDGCWFCPNATKKEIGLVKESRPDLLYKIWEMINLCDYDISMSYNRNHWVEDFFNTRGFIPKSMVDKQISLFD